MQPNNPTSTIFVRYRHGTELRVPADIKTKLRLLAKQLDENVDPRIVFRGAIEDIKDGSGAGIALESTWTAAAQEIFLAFEQDRCLDEEAKNVIVGLFMLLSDARGLSESWDQIRSCIVQHIDILSGWKIVRPYRTTSFFGDIQRDSDGRYYVIRKEEKVEVIGAKTTEEERFQYVADDITRRYGRIGRILRLVALIDIADQYTRSPEHFSDRIVCWLPDTNGSSAYLQWNWHVAGIYNYVPVSWRTRSHFSAPDWLGSDLLANLPEAPRITPAERLPPADPYMQEFQEASRGFRYQYDLAVQTDLFFGERPEVYFAFQGRKVRWINGTRFVNPIVSVWCNNEDVSDGRMIIKRFLSLLVNETKRGIVEIAGVSGAPRYYPFIRQPRTLGGFILDARYLIQEDLSEFSDRKWFALALYKEAVNSNSVYYSFLCFYKIIELAFRDDETRIAQWLDTTIDAILQRVEPGWKREAVPADQSPSAYLKNAGRHAVAHAGVDGRLRSGAEAVNPDEPEHYRKFARDIRVMQALADRLLQEVSWWRGP